MRTEDTPSWNIGIAEGNHILHRALFVRDAAGLIVPPADVVPPPLSPAPRQVALESRQRREQAGKQWLAWWLELVTVAVLDVSGLPRASFDPENLHALADETAPGRIHSLASARELQAVLQLHWSSADEFFEFQAPDLPVAANRRVVGEIIEQAVSEYGHIGSTHIQVVVLRVSGDWVHVVKPGLVLCSVELTRSHGSLRDLIRRGIESNL